MQNWSNFEQNWEFELIILFIRENTRTKEHLINVIFGLISGLC